MRDYIVAKTQGLRDRTQTSEERERLYKKARNLKYAGEVALLGTVVAEVHNNHDLTSIPQSLLIPLGLVGLAAYVVGNFGQEFAFRRANIRSADNQVESR